MEGGGPGARSHGPGRVRAGGRAARGALAALGAALLLLAGAAAASAERAEPLTPALPGYDLGELHVVFPGATPSVEISQHANSTVEAGLYVDQVIEYVPDNSDHPLVVQSATPTNATPFSGEPASSGSSSFGLDLRGSVPVVRISVPVWSVPWENLPNGSAGALAPVTGGTTLTVVYNYTNAGPTRQGLALSFNIRGWPWLATGDQLGVELRYASRAAVGFDACASTPALNGSPTESCEGTVLAPGVILWNQSGISSLVARDPAGLSSAFSWGAHASLAGDQSAPVTAAAYDVSTTTTHVILSASARGSENVTTSAELLLTVPAPAPLASVLAGDPIAYGATAVGALASALGAVIVYRRSERRQRDAL